MQCHNGTLLLFPLLLDTFHRNNKNQAWPFVTNIYVDESVNETFAGILPKILQSFQRIEAFSSKNKTLLCFLLPCWVIITLLW